MPQLTHPICAHPLQCLIRRAWRENECPQCRVSTVLRRYESFLHKLAKAIRRSRRLGGMLMLGELGVIHDEEQMRAALAERASGTDDAFICVFLSLDQALDKQNHLFK